MSYHMWRSRWIHERRIGAAAWVAFVPHRRGLPAVVDEVTHAVLDIPDSGEDAEDVVRRVRRRYPECGDAALRTLIAACTALGFLSDAPEAPRFHAAQATAAGARRLAVWLHLTNRCNLDCGYCFVDRKAPRNMSATTVERAVEAIASTATARGIPEVDVRLGGGEPTLVLPIAERAHGLLARRLGTAGIALTTRIVTNGTRADERFLAFARRPGVGVTVSIDGYGPAHDLHRVFGGTNRGSWSLVSANVEKYRVAGVEVVIAATLSEGSCSSLPRLVSWTVEHALPVHLQVVSEPERPWRGATPARDDYRNYNRCLIAALDEALRLLEDTLGKGEPVPNLTIDQLSLDEPSFGRCCGIGTSYAAITERGEAAPCPTLARTRRGPLGDDLVASAATLLHSPTCRSERENDPCLACQWFPACTGGCPAVNERVNGDEFSVSPLCDFRRFAIPRYAEYLGRRLHEHARRLGVHPVRILHVPRAWSAPHVSRA